MIYTIYNPTTGAIERTFTCSSAEKAAENLEGLTYIEGNYDARKYYIVNEQPVEKAADPSTNTHKYLFNDTTKQWELDVAVTEKLIRKQRTIYLSLVDKINPIWWSSLTAEQQLEVAQFRQALLDISAQANFPEEVVWPSVPGFL